MNMVFWIVLIEIFSGFDFKAMVFFIRIDSNFSFGELVTILIAPANYLLDYLFNTTYQNLFHLT